MSIKRRLEELGMMKQANPKMEALKKLKKQNPASPLGSALMNLKQPNVPGAAMKGEGAIPKHLRRGVAAGPKNNVPSFLKKK